MDNNINDNILENFDKSMLPKHIAKNLSHRRRHLHFASEQTVGKMHYTVVSILPMPYDGVDAETVADKLGYLISGKKVNKKLSGLVKGDAV